MARPSTKREEATRWLKEYLSQGQRPVSSIERAGAALDFEWRTLQRVKTHLGVESTRRGNIWYWRDPDVLDDQQGTPSLVQAIQELTRAVRQLSKSSTVTVPIAPIEPEDEPDTQEPIPPADAEHLAQTARGLFEIGNTIETIESELLQIAHKFPCNPPLSDDFVCKIAETYGRRQEPPKPKPLPEIITTDDPYGLLERAEYADILKLQEQVKEHLNTIPMGDPEMAKWMTWRKRSYVLMRQKQPGPSS